MVSKQQIWSSLVTQIAYRWQQLSLGLWVGSTWLIVGLVLIPIGVVLSSIGADTGDVWIHLATTVLPRYLLNSLGLVVGVGVGVSVIGITTAWLVTMCQFPGRGWLEWGLLLPLAAPAYVLAYTYTSFLDISGPVQTLLRQILKLEPGSYGFPSIRSLPGAILMLSLVLYPYVYLVTRLAFLEQSARTLEASRSLGCGPWRMFVTVAIPLARPSTMAGLALVLMETLNDYGTVQYFGVQTFSTGIFRTWYGMGDRVAATQLAAILLLFTLGLILWEQASRRRSRYYQSGSVARSVNRFPLNGIRRLGAWLVCGLPITLGFLLPGGLLLAMTVNNWDLIQTSRFWQYGWNSFILACATATIAVMISLILAYTRRIHTKWYLKAAVQIAAIGYAIPGSVIAVGILIPLGFWDTTVSSWLSTNVGISGGRLSGSIAAVVFAYLVRFLAVSLGTLEASLLKIRPNLDEAARSLGCAPVSIFFKIHLPLLWRGLLTSALLVFVDVMKELPATIVIRPFNFETLAVRAYQLASDERLVESSAPALAIVIVGILPVMILSWQISHHRD